MVAIIGVLAAVAIPAYQKYQETAKVSVIRGSLNQVVKAFNACISVKAVGDCDDKHIDMTLSEQNNAAITVTTGSGANADEKCFLVTGSNTLAGFTGCVAFDKNGQVTAQTSTDMQVTAVATMCTTNTCTP